MIYVCRRVFGQPLPDIPVDGAAGLLGWGALITPLPDMPIAERPVPEIPMDCELGVTRIVGAGAGGFAVAVGGPAVAIVCMKQPKAHAKASVMVLLDEIFTKWSSVTGPRKRDLVVRLCRPVWSRFL